MAQPRPRTLAQVIPLEQRRHDSINSRRVPPSPDATPTTDMRWVITDPTERTVIAHLRGWTHFGPVCPLCKGGA